MITIRVVRCSAESQVKVDHRECSALRHRTRPLASIIMLIRAIASSPSLRVTLRRHGNQPGNQAGINAATFGRLLRCHVRRSLVAGALEPVSGELRWGPSGVGQ
jgi:hypothetical protein